MFEAWNVPKRSDEGLHDLKQHLVVYMIAVETRISSSRMRTHTRQYSQLPCMHALFCLISCTKRTEVVPKPTMSHELVLYKGNFASSFSGIIVPQSPQYFG